MRTIVTSALMAAGLGLACFQTPLHAEEGKVKTPPAETNVQSGELEPNVQIAILLDTSGSMSGLINQARSQLWKIVNEMVLGKQNGKSPRIQIALYEYGNSGLKETDDYIRQISPLTDDLDVVSEKLFKLTTNGGDEYCGAVIGRATKELEWNMTDKNALKMIFIAGNEPFNQGKTSPDKAIKEALKKGITVNTIYCGNENYGEAKGWKDGAISADGSYICINHNAAPPTPETPYDKELAKLSNDLNGTYVAYGKKEVRQAKLSLQSNIDAEVAQFGASQMADRAMTKSNNIAYSNTTWDLVDMKEKVEASGNVVNLKDLQTGGELPEELEGKSEEEIKAYIDEKGKEREEIRQKMKSLGEKRDGWLDEKMKELKDQPTTLDKAIIDSVRKQAGKKQFIFDKK